MPFDNQQQQPFLEMQLLMAQRDMHSQAAQNAHLEILLRLAGEENDKLRAELAEARARITEMETSVANAESRAADVTPIFGDNAAVEGAEAA